MSIFKPCPIDDVASFGTTDRFGTMDLSGALEHVIFTQNLGKIPMFNYYMSQMDSNHHLQDGPLPVISHKWVMGPHKWPKINGFSWGKEDLLVRFFGPILSFDCFFGDILLSTMGFVTIFHHHLGQCSFAFSKHLKQIHP